MPHLKPYPPSPASPHLQFLSWITPEPFAPCPNAPCSSHSTFPSCRLPCSHHGLYTTRSLRTTLWRKRKMAQFCSISVSLPLKMLLFYANNCVDRHLVHEVTSPVGKHYAPTCPRSTHTTQQAFEGLRNADRKVRRPDCTLATVDHVCSPVSS